MPAARGSCHAWGGAALPTRQGADERVELRVVRVALAARRRVELVARRAEERALVDDVLVLGQDLGPPVAQQLDRRVAREEEQPLLVRLGDGDAVAQQGLA